MRMKGKKPLHSLKKTDRCEYYKRLLDTKRFPEFPIERIAAESFDYFKVLESGFHVPFVVTGYDEAFGIKIPVKSDCDMSLIAQEVGPDTPVRIIEVGKQAEVFGYTIQQYGEALTKHMQGEAAEGEGMRTLNMISLEFSGTKLANRVSSPLFVNLIDWVRCLWPDWRRSRNDYPRVQKYCLAGMQGSYTDFHIDFGGTSVWYHILKGSKVFYLIPPSSANLRVYEQWTSSVTQGDSFLGDLVAENQCFTFTLSHGETLIIPSGWIHSVYTPLDSIVFGGNFLHSYSILRQLQSYSIESKTKIKQEYLFPKYKQIHFYFLTELLQYARDIYSSENIKRLHDHRHHLTPLSSVYDAHGGSSMFHEDIKEVDNITAMIAKHLYLPSILRQLPLLVRACEVWVKEGESKGGKSGGKRADKGGEREDMQGEFLRAAEEVNLSPDDVIREWWGVVNNIIDYSILLHDENIAFNVRRDDVNSIDREEIKKYIHNIRYSKDNKTLESLLFDESIVSYALPSFALEVNKLTAKVDFDRSEVRSNGTDFDLNKSPKQSNECNSSSAGQTAVSSKANDNNTAHGPHIIDIDSLFHLGGEDDHKDNIEQNKGNVLTVAALYRCKRKFSGQKMQDILQREKQQYGVETQGENEDDNADVDGNTMVNRNEYEVDEDDILLSDEEDDEAYTSRKRKSTTGKAFYANKTSANKTTASNAAGSTKANSAVSKSKSIRDMIMKKCAVKRK